MKNENYKKEKVYIIAWDASFREYIHFYKTLLSRDIVFDFEILLVDFYDGNSAGFKKAIQDLKNTNLSYEIFLMRNKKNILWNYGKCINFVIAKMLIKNIEKNSILIIPDADVYIPINTYNKVYENLIHKTNLINYVPRYDQASFNEQLDSNETENINTIELLDKQCELKNSTNYAGFASFHLKDLMDVGGYEEHSFFDGPGALGMDLYLRFRNCNKKIQWLYDHKIFHPRHSNTGGKLTLKTTTQKQSLILKDKQKNINYYPLESRLCHKLSKINFTQNQFEQKNNRKRNIFNVVSKIFKIKLRLPIPLPIISDEKILLSSFPKAGNTWIRFVLGNIYNEIEKKKDPVDFYTIHDIIPEVGQGAPKFKNLPQIFKTHGLYKDNFKKIILILRNPFDTLYSYHQYLNKEKNINISLSEVIRSKQYGINSIIEHTNSYVKNCDNLLVITYENMKNSPTKTTEKICDFLEINISDKMISEALNNSSFESMRKIEIEKGRKFGNKNFLFTRKGEVGEGIKKIEKEDREYIKKILKKSPFLNLLYN